MSTVETTPLVKQVSISTVAHNDPKQSKQWKTSAIAGDIVTLGTGIGVAGLVNVLLVFLIPRLLTIEQYGYWRLFLLYAGYVGFLHFGFADGALLRWAGRPLQEFQHELWPATRYLFWQHLILLVPICAILWLFVPGPLRFIGIALAIYALLYNVSATLQFALQGARLFRPVAISMVGGPALVLVFAVLGHARFERDFRQIIGFYLLGWFGVLVYLLTRCGAAPAKVSKTSTKRLSLDCILSGWPIVIANTCMTLIAYVDRLTLSWAATIQNFAQYSLAASAMMVPVTAIQACSKVFFSHLASVPPERRKRIYRLSTRLLLIVWAMLLPYYFALSFFVRHFLPRYIESLVCARILLLGIPFLAAIQILQTSYAYLNGIQKQFLVRTVFVLVVALGSSTLIMIGFSSLVALAVTQVAILAGWWLFNELTLDVLSEEAKRDWTKFVIGYALIAGSYWLTTDNWTSLVPSLVIFYCLTVVVLAITCQDEVRFVLARVRNVWQSSY